ncbi:MAG: YfhO family protein [Ferruginibacter sp.]
MKKINYKDYLPHLVAIVIFLLVSIIYCLPLFQGMVVNQHDMLGTKGMTQQSFEFYEKYGRYPLWTNSMFGGMPTYQIFFAGKYNINLSGLQNVFTAFLPSPASLFFLSCICFYILTQVLKLKPWVGIFGSLAYAFASYNAVIAVVGHVTKFATMGYAPAVIAGLILLMKRKYILGFAATMLFSTLFVIQNHVQMVYYFTLVIVCLGISFLIKTIQTKDYRHFFISAGLAIAAVTISVCLFAVVLLPTNEYAKETMRGGRSELTLDTKKDKSTGGLDKEYAFGWSYGKAETFTFALPNFMGSDSDPSKLGENSNIVEALQGATSGNQPLPGQAINAFYGSMSPYWGDQPNTAGPVYLGAIVCLLVIAGLFFVPRRYLSWLIPASIIGIVLAWGNNLSSVNYFLFDHLPGLNKFRSPSSAMVIPQLTFALIASLALQHIFYNNFTKEQLFKKLKFAGLGALALIVILVGFYFSASFTNLRDKQTKDMITQQITQMAGQGKEASPEMAADAGLKAGSFTKAIIKDRKEMYSSDLLRFLLYALLAGIVIWLGSIKKLKAGLAIGIITAISFIDLITVDIRYLDKSHYTTPDDYVSGFTPNTADNQIKSDTGYFRVFDQSTGGDPFQDSHASYFHNSIGGYSPAKLALYEDLKTYQLQKNNMQVYNMLNTKYIITSDPTDQSGRRTIARRNDEANGSCWFVKGIRYVNNANEEMLALDSLHTKDSAVIDKREQSKVTLVPQFDSSASIAFVKNLNDDITYQSKSATNQFAVFSEIYYPHGWKAYIDDKETPIVKVDYLLRGLCIPAGNHTIHFEFRPKSYDTGNTINLIAGIISILAVIVCAFLLYKQNKKNPNSVEEESPAK